ncbi:MAG: hypothetical protein ABR915_17740 [Thermoguttaceae bacterium]|jgi:hypothetical protein
MKRVALVLLLTVSPLLAGAGLADADLSPAALALVVKGKTMIRGLASADGGPAERLLASHSTIYADQQLLVSPDAQVTLLFWSDGHIEQIAAPGTFKVALGGCQPRTGIKQLKVAEPSRAVVDQCRNDFRRQFSAVVARSGDGGQGDVSSAGAGRGELRPILDSTVLAAKPVFAWPARSKAAKYTVSLYFLENRIWSAVTEATRLEYSGETPLRPDEMYSWRVTTTLDDGKVVTLCGGVFRTASGPQRETAAGLEKLLARPEPPYLAMAAIWYKQNGFIPEAIAADEQLARLAPDAGVYRELSRLYVLAGRSEDAFAANLKAAELEKKGHNGSP